MLLWFLRQGLILSSRLASNNPPTQTLDARVIGVCTHIQPRNKISEEELRKNEDIQTTDKNDKTKRVER